LREIVQVASILAGRLDPGMIHTSVKVWPQDVIAVRLRDGPMHPTSAEDLLAKRGHRAPLQPRPAKKDEPDGWQKFDHHLQFRDK